MSFLLHFMPKWAWISQKIEKFFFISSTVSTRLRLEHFQNNRQKILKKSFWLPFYTNRAGTGQKREKIFLFRVPFLPDLGWSIPKKKSKKNSKNQKNVILASFLAKPGQDKPKKEINFFCSKYLFYPTRAVEFPKKRVKKLNFLFKKNSFGLHFYINQARTDQKREKIFFRTE